MNLQSILYALALLLSGTILLIVAGLGAIVFLANRDCGPSFGYLGCETPTAKVNTRGDQVASGMRSPQSGAPSPCASRNSGRHGDKL